MQPDHERQVGNPLGLRGSLTAYISSNHRATFSIHSTKIFEAPFYFLFSPADSSNCILRNKIPIKKVKFHFLSNQNAFGLFIFESSDFLSFLSQILLLYCTIMNFFWSSCQNRQTAHTFFLFFCEKRIIFEYADSNMIRFSWNFLHIWSDSKLNHPVNLTKTVSIRRKVPWFILFSLFF